MAQKTASASWTAARTSVGQTGSGITWPLLRRSRCDEESCRGDHCDKQDDRVLHVVGDDFRHRRSSPASTLSTSLAARQ
jgi:hypothetical protein